MKVFLVFVWRTGVVAGCGMKQLLLLVALLFVLAGCGGGSDNFQPASSKLSMFSVYQQLALQKAAVKAAAPTTAQQTSVIAMFQAMFNAAPGADLLNLCADLLAGGMSEATLANLLAGTALFQSSSLYPNSLSNLDFSLRFLDNLVGITVSDTSKITLAAQMAELLNGGWKRSDLIWLLVSALRNLPTTDVVWGKAAAQLNNRLDVSYYYSVTKSTPSSDLVTLQAVTASVTDDPATVIASKATIDRSVSPAPTLGAPSNVTVQGVDSRTVGSFSITSSTKLSVAWSAPASGTVNHYDVTATEAVQNTSVSATSTTTSLTLTGLKAATPYTITVKACTDAACSQSATSASLSATTSSEYWQLQGTGNSVSTLTKPVSDGNARLSATRFGGDAGATANTIQFYYGPGASAGSSTPVSGLAVAASSTVSVSNPSSYISGFTSYAATYGIRSVANPAMGIKSIMTGQGVPLSAAFGAPKVRLFFEASGVDSKTRIYFVDSVDGYTGRDFNANAATTCTSSADYATTGGCPATIVIGVDGDTTKANPKIVNARQHKLAYPTLTDWRWDGAPGSFMVFTVDQISGCSTHNVNHGYAVWNGTEFAVQYEANGCPKLFKSMQAALPMHLGDARYKMYYGDPSINTGKVTSSPFPFLGPKKLLYANGAKSGDAGVVDFEDWESVGNGRNLVFLWPNGEQLNDTAEGYIDDFHFLTPTGSLDIQVGYVTITDGTVVPFAATAVLLNP